MTMREQVTSEYRDEFFKAYVNAALYTDGDFGDDDDRSFSDHGLDESNILVDVLNQMRKECDAFIDANAADLLAADDDPDFDCDADQAGYDFWMTRNGHGVGFWEDGDWPDEMKDRLADAARAVGERDMLFDDEEHTVIGMFPMPLKPDEEVDAHISARMPAVRAANTREEKLAALLDGADHIMRLALKDYLNRHGIVVTYKDTGVY